MPELIKEDNVTFAVGIAKNTGQAIWSMDKSTTIETDNEDEKIEINSTVFTDIEPGKIGIILYRKL